MGKNTRPTVSRIGCRGWGAGPSFPLCEPEGRASGRRKEVLDQERETSSKYCMSERAWTASWASVCMSLKAATEAGGLSGRSAEG